MSLYDKVVAIATEFLGPAAEDYMRRRIRIAMQGAPPEELSAERLGRLIVGVEMTAKMYVTERKAKELIARIRDLKG